MSNDNVFTDPPPRGSSPNIRIGDSARVNESGPPEIVGYIARVFGWDVAADEFRVRLVNAPTAPEGFRRDFTLAPEALG